MPITLPMVKPRMLKHRLPPGKPDTSWSRPNRDGRQTCRRCAGRGVVGRLKRPCVNCGEDGFRWRETP